MEICVLLDFGTQITRITQIYHDMNKGLPENFLERLTDIVGPSLFREIEKTFVERPTTFRVNIIKAKREDIVEHLNSNGFKIRQIPWYKDAFVLLNKTKRELCDLEIYEQGKIYVQSLASMIPPLVLDPQPGEKVLDLTAAPGSKTSQIAALMKQDGELVANDNNKIRFFKLKHNMEVLGVNAKLRMEHGADLCREYPEYFDRILLDAPCSAEARFIDGDPKTYGYWKEHKIKEMAYKQRQLLFSAWTALKPGGTLVYSTCTFAPEENEVQISRLIERNDDVEILDISAQGGPASGWKRLPAVKQWKNHQIHPEVVKKAMRIMPTKEIEGFFVCKIKKHP